jgi:hypothetical protein
MYSDMPTRVRAASILGFTATLGLFASGLASASLAQDISATPTGPAAVTHDWPGSRANRNLPGLYSWTVGPKRWMHHHSCAAGSEWGDSPCTSDPLFGPVEITFEALADDAYSIPVDSIGRPGDELEGPFLGFPDRVSDSRTQAWVLEFDGTKVVVIIKSYPNTSAEFIAEAEAVVRSAYVDPKPDGTGVGRRVVFTLPAGWDSG